METSDRIEGHEWCEFSMELSIHAGLEVSEVFVSLLSMQAFK